MKNIEILKENVAKRLGCDVDKLVIENGVKNNGVKVARLTLIEDNAPASPAVYIDDVVDQWESGYGMSTGSAADEITRRIRYAQKKTAGANEIHLDKQFVLQNAYLQVIGAEQNAEILNETPHRIIADLAAIVRVAIDTGSSDYVSSARVTRKMMDVLGIDDDELFRAAKENCIERDGYRVASLKNMLFGLLCDDNSFDENESFEEAGMYVVTNASKINGAAVLAIPELMEKFIRKVGGKAYILPSSIHEILLLVGNVMDVEDLKNMVSSINGSEVKPEEVLSNNVYEFDLETRELRVAA